MSSLAMVCAVILATGADPVVRSTVVAYAFWGSVALLVWWIWF